MTVITKASTYALVYWYANMYMCVYILLRLKKASRVRALRKTDRELEKGPRMSRLVTKLQNLRKKASRLLEDSAARCQLAHIFRSRVSL